MAGSRGCAVATADAGGPSLTDVGDRWEDQCMCGRFAMNKSLSINHRMQQPDHPTAVGVSGPDYAAVRAALRSASRAFQV